MPSALLNCTVAIALAALFVKGCASISGEFDRKAVKLNLKREVVTGARFQHVIYSNSEHSSKTLHIYLDGDGTTWVAGRPANDPTPQNPMVLNLMAMDNAPAVYLGRPCYHGATAKGGCSSRFWRNDRYSKEGVISLAAVVEKLLQQGGYQDIAWFGHSGGGTLAVLLASRFPQTKSLVTVAAALDLDKWISVNGTNGLSGSLNPASLSTLAKTIRQRHYAGANDRLEPPALMAAAAAHLGSELIIVEGYDHVCCWEQIWPSILNHLAD